MSKQLRIWLFVLLGTLLTSTSLLAEGVITLTTSKKVGETIKLDIYAKGNVIIEGARETGRRGSLWYEDYEISSQTITIRGDVIDLRCHENQLTSLDVSGCTSLTELNCYNNQLTSLDVSGCTALTELNCYNNQLTSLDASGCIALTELDCGKNQLTSLNVSGCTALTKLDCWQNKQTSLDLSGCTALTTLNCSWNQLTNLDVSDCTALTELYCGSNRLTSLDVSGCTALTTLSCSSNPLTRLEASGCTALTKLDCFANPLTSINLSRCQSLKEFSWSGGKLTSLDVSGCIALIELYCYGNQLTRLDVTSCASLTKLNCSDNQLTNLDVSKNTALTELDCYNNQINGENMTKLVNSLPSRKEMSAGSLVVVNRSEDEKNLCRPSDIAIAQEKNWTLKWENGKPYKGIGEGVITMITSRAVGRTVQLRIEANSDVLIEGVRKSPQQYRNNYYTLTSQTITIRGDVTRLDCSYNQLTSLNVTSCASLTELNSSDNQLTNLNVSGHTALTRLDCSSNPLTSLNLSNCKSLKGFTWNKTKLASLNISGCTALTMLDCRENLLTSVDVSGCISLTKLDCSYNQLTSLDVSGCTALTVLFCYGNPLTSINLSNCTSLKGFTWKEGKLFSLDVSGCTALKWLNCDENKLTSLDVSSCTALIGLGCKNNQLTSLDVSKNTVLTTLDCSKNQLTRLDVSGFSALTELYCWGDQLTSLDVSGCTALTKLDCHENQLTRLDVSDCTSLGQLDCSDNPLTSIDLSNCKSLKEFTWNKKELTSLNVSGCTALTELDCNNNQLINLDVSNCTSLTKLVCYKNRLKGEAMTQMVTGLPDWVGKESGSLYVVCDESDENNLLRSDVLTASRKNWRVFKYIVNTGKSVLYSGAGGDDEIVMTITKEQYLEGGIRLAILADGDVTIEGVHEKRIFTDGSKHTYTLAGTQVTIRGDISELDCSENQITNLDLSKCNSLWTLNCSGNRLTNVDVSGCSLLTYLNCSNNQINGENMTRLVTNLPSRTRLRSGNLVIISRRESEGNLCRPSDVAIAQEKNWISTWENGDLCKGIGEGAITMTTSRSVGQSFELRIVAKEDVVIEGVREEPIRIDGQSKGYTLTSQTVTIRGHVTSLDCSINNLTSLDASGCTALTKLQCQSNQLTSLDVSGCTALTELDCNGNQLTSLDVSKNSALTSLGCSDNQLTSLDVSKNSALTSLGCSDNQLTSLDVSKNTSLTGLSCSSNQLTSLDVSKNTALTRLNCSVNQINGEGMTKLLNSLPDRKGMSSGTLGVVDYSSKKKDKNRCSFADVAIASEKNWTVQKYEPYYWTSYSGVGEGVITMTTSKAVGEKVYLGIEANGDVVIEGVSENPQLGRNRDDYTLTSQTIIIQGDVIKLYCQDNQLSSLDLSQNSTLTELNCSRNKLKTLDLSACSNLKSLTCYRNKIRGNAVAQLVESLPDRYGKEPGEFYFVYYSKDEYEENFCYRPAVGRASDKNWRPQKQRYYGGWEDYFGVIDEGVVMMRTAQEVGSQITLTLEAKGDVAIDGVKGVPETDGKPHQYTLLSQDVTIRGYVTKLHCSGNKLTSLDLSTTVPLVELDCSNNQLTALDVSQNAAVTSLTCYRNQIKGEAMALLIKGLPQLPLRSTHLFGIVSNAADEGNVFLKADVERVRDKGWSPMKWDEKRRQYEPYAGKETESFAVTLTKEGKGTISATGADDLTAVPYGTELTIVATPTEGYELISLTAGEEDILATKKVVVTDNVTVKATFDEATFAVTLTKEGKGTISATGADDLTAVPYGTELTIVATPATGYKLTALTANGTDILATKKVVIKGATEVKATFVDHTGVETTVTQQVKLYPNPATDHIIVEGVVPASEVTLHSLTGERLYAGRTDSRGMLQIDLTPYADGVYLVCVAGETYRVVVRR